LASVYVNRGVALRGQGDLAGAVRDYGAAIALQTTLRDTLARLGQDWPPAFQNDLASVYVNRGVALDSQGDLAGAVRDYGAAIELMTTLLFDRQFAPVLPNLAKVYYNLVLLSQRADLPATFSAEAMQTQAREFLTRLEERVAIAQLPEHWRREVEDLRGVLGGLKI
jgi:tetratricopeptide (TPR) repeat protein